MIKYLSEKPLKGIEEASIADINYVLALNEVFLDTETTGLDPYTNKPILLILGDEEIQLVIDLRTKKDVAVTILNSLQDKLWIAHNAKFDAKMLAIGLGYMHYNWYCTEVASRVLYNGLPLKHGLDACLLRHFKIEMSKQQRSSFINKKDSTNFIANEIIYAATDIKYLSMLYKRQLELIKQFDLEYLLNPITGLEHRFIPALCNMELQGINIDKTKWLLAIEETKALLIEAETQLMNELATLKLNYKFLKNRKYNLSSTDDIYYIFKHTNQLQYLKKRDDLDAYREKQLEKARTTNLNKAAAFVGSKKKNKIAGYTANLFDIPEQEIKIEEKEEYAFGKPNIKEFMEDNPDSPLYDLLEHLLEYKKLQKLVTTYGTTFLEKLHPITNKLHSEYSQAYTKTGRLSSSNPNLQNIPQSKTIRNAFIAEEGYSLLTIDYGGQELAIIASQSKDPLLMKAANEEFDLHSLLAKESYSIIQGKPVEVSKSINKELRNKHKPVLFGLLYGAGPFRIHKVLGIPIQLAKQVKQRIEKVLHRAFEYLTVEREKGFRTKAVRDGSKTNRRRLFTNEAEHSIRKQSGNFKIQSTGASMVKEAMTEVDLLLKPYRKDFPKTYVIMQVHDEIVCQLPLEYDKILAEQIKTKMIEVGLTYLQDVKLDAEYQLLPYWTK
jgi:DNA polymerase I-like protein with 3'-5' exonuclease and polymerase domains